MPEKQSRGFSCLALTEHSVFELSMEVHFSAFAPYLVLDGKICQKSFSRKSHLVGVCYLWCISALVTSPAPYLCIIDCRGQDMPRKHQIPIWSVLEYILQI